MIPALPTSVSAGADAAPELAVICKSLREKNVEKVPSWNSFHQGEAAQLAPHIPYSHGAESSETQEQVPLSVHVHLSVWLSSVAMPFSKGTAGGRVDDGWAEDKLK